jgi:hypothetical protein
MDLGIGENILLRSSMIAKACPAKMDTGFAEKDMRNQRARAG